jgi:tetratricopeptide (TPR) repeat protein
MLAEAQLATGDAATALRTVSPLSDSVLAGQRELDLAVRAAQAANDPAVAALAARLHSPQFRTSQKLAADAQAALTRQDWTAAIAAYRQIPGYDGDAEVLRRLAEASAKAGQADAALGFADKALDLAPRNADMLHTAALVRLQTGRDRERMLRLMNQATELDPANHLFRADLARASAAGG